MKSVAAILSVVCGVVSAGCFLTGGGQNVARAQIESVTTPDDDIHNRYPQLLTLEQKLDRASTYFYFGEHELAGAAARDLIVSVADFKETSPDSAVCDYLDYLGDRARCLLRRMTEDVLDKETTSNMMAFVDSVARTSNVNDEIEIEYNPKTNYWLHYFQGNGRKHFARWLDRTGEFKGIIEPILVEVGIPRDLLYLAVIESGLNMDARSHMKAIGPWQFMSGTARLFGLRMSWWLDERRDIIASTYAAANYLKYLYDLFGSWPLALASYNAGEHRVAYAMTRQRTNDYWRLRLPEQTTWFVPKFMAALAIGRNPEAYGFEKPCDKPMRFDLIEVERPVELRTIAEAADCSVNDIKDLNPHFKKWCTPPDMVVEVKVPAGAGQQCLSRLAEMKTKRMASFMQHKVKKGETLSDIAAQYELSVKELRRFNEMGASQSIRVGTILLIPIKDERRPSQIASKPSYRNPAPIRDNISIPLLGARQREKTITYVVKHDDTLIKIAERFHAGLADLRAWNKLSTSSVIRPGDTITVHAVSDRAPEAMAADNLDGVSIRGEEGRDPASGETAGGEEAPSQSGEKCVVHVVKKGETLSAISRLYGTRLSDVLAWNEKAARGKLHPGDKIRIWLKVD